jgi:hypothetical protein
MISVITITKTVYAVLDVLQFLSIMESVINNAMFRVVNMMGMIVKQVLSIVKCLLLQDLL